MEYVQEEGKEAAMRENQEKNKKAKGLSLKTEN